MLDLDLDLEADLGVDTVKQAEIFAAVRETYNIPRDPNLKLRDFPTLARVIQFVYDRRPDLKAPQPVPAPAPPTPTHTTDHVGTASERTHSPPHIPSHLIAITADNTQYANDTL